MNDKKPLMDYRRVQKLQTPLLLTGALLSGVGTSVSVPLVILGIAIMLFAIVIGVLYYRCPHCGRPLGRIGEGGAYCPHCGKALNAPVEESVRSITVPAYAKLNLTLDILGKRDDGYHEMQMVMQTVSLHDDVTVTLTDGKGITCRVDGAALPCDERNLAVKAARAFCEAMDYGGGIDIALIKRIPSEAGMAGGSADAAAVLRALRELVSPTLTDERLEQISASVGSDVPFCIRGGTQLAEGRGEKLTVLKPAPRFFVAACKPDFPISTPALFARVDGFFPTSPSPSSSSTPALFARVDGVTITDRPDTDAMLAAIEHGDADTLCANVRNVFEQALDGEQRERIETIKRDLLAYGAKTSAMTGSGSVVFGLFSDKAACRRACEALQGECVKTFCAEFV